MICLANYLKLHGIDSLHVSIKITSSNKLAEYLCKPAPRSKLIINEDCLSAFGELQ